jgi:prohibitin 1
VVRSWGDYDGTPLKDAGLYAVSPWKKVKRVSVQTTKKEVPATVPTKGGLVVELHTVMMYRVKPEAAPAILREIGDDYEAKLIDPYLKNAVRDVCSGYPLEALYTDARLEIEGKLRSRLENDLDGRGFVVEQAMVQTPEMPPTVKARIESKIAAEQDALKMQYVLQSARLEAERRLVEAEGIARSQAVIKKDLDDNYLRYLWIEALKQHSGSVIYVPTGNDGMPFFNPVHAPAR